MILGIVPAGGNSDRFGGYPKELLPIGKGQILIDRTITALNFGGAEKIVILSSAEKIGLHAKHLGTGFYYSVKRDDILWHSIMATFSYGADWNLFAMPDTYYPQDVFDKPEMHQTDFNIGTFETIYPERFGVLIDGEIRDKEKLGAGVYTAWGVLSWSKRVFKFWLDNIADIKTHTDAFNLAIKEFGYSKYNMEYYHDMASWEDYKFFVQGEL